MVSVSLNDAVHVKLGDQSLLEGVVLYVGPSSDSTSEGVLVGVRLTGGSAGRGSCDGSPHFSCPANCGVFVRASAVTKRTLSRLEELRLRRELNAAPTGSAGTAVTGSTGANVSTGATSSTVASVSTGASAGAPALTAGSKSSRSSLSSSSRRSSSGGAITPAAAATPATTSKSPPPSGNEAPGLSTSQSTESLVSLTGSGSTPGSAPGSALSSKSKLEELRLRRAQLKEKKSLECAEGTGAQRPESASDDSLPLDEGASDPLAASLSDQLRSKERDIVSLRQKLMDTAESSKAKIQELELAVREAKKREALSKSTASPSRLAASHEIPESVQEQLSSLENKSLDLSEKLEQALLDLTTARSDLEREKKAHRTTADEASKARTEAISYQNQLQAISDQSSARGQSDASHYKERAKLQAELSNAKRKIEQFDKERTELENTIEDLTLDKEQLQEEKEALEDRLEELKLDAETAMMEVEELKMELEDSRAANERLLHHQDSKPPLSATSPRSSTAQANQLPSPLSASSSFERDIAAEDSKDGDLHHQQQESAEMAQALQVQNARLREALIRLREQSALEKMEMTRQLRSMEKQSQTAADLQLEVARMTEVIANLEEQINDLKDMVEQGAAFEGMVEDLSDRVLSLEEDNVMLQSVVREMEEAAELTAEMEEVQADEIKALTLEMEGRNVIIRNLEEAIKIQRRREDDFRRTVGNYKMTVDTLRQEKAALLELHEGGEGEKSDLIAASQKALTKAAQLVADAAATRKREAIATADLIDKLYYLHLSNRLELLVPHTVPEVTTEIASIKGELLGARVVAKTSKALECIETSFHKSIKPQLIEPTSDLNYRHQDYDDDDETKIPIFSKLPDEVQQHVTTMFHQAEFAHVLVNVSADVVRLLAATQWPDVLSPELSTELGIVLGHTLPDLDGTIHSIVRSIQEEGSLTVEQSNIGTLTLTVQNTIQELKSNLERLNGSDTTAGATSTTNTTEDRRVSSLLTTWYPPGWQMLKDASLVKFACQGSAAALSLAVNNYNSDGDLTPKASLLLRNLYRRVEQSSTQAASVCQRISSMMASADTSGSNSTSFTGGLMHQTLSELMKQSREESEQLLKAIKSLLLSPNDGETLEASRTATERILRLTTKLLASLRSSSSSSLTISTNTQSQQQQQQQLIQHPLSPEVKDAWFGIASLTQTMRSLDTGDSDDVNFYIRAHKIEHMLRSAIENVPKLTLANQKVTSLEKSLSIRSKEIAIQNARLSELERTVAKSNSSSSASGSGGFGGRSKTSTSDMKLAEEYNTLKEENRVLTEAMEVMQREVEMYENEIRALKDQKTPKRGGTAQGTNQRGTPSRRSTVADYVSSSSSSPHHHTRGAVIGASGTSGTGASMGNSIDASADFLHGGGANGTGMGGILEATLFRPALQQALREVNRWKAASISSSILDLPPLMTTPLQPRLPSGRTTTKSFSAQIGDEKEEEKEEKGSFMESSSLLKTWDDDNDEYIRLTSVLHHYRMVKASVMLVDLTRSQNSKHHAQQPRAQLHEMIVKSNAANGLLESSIKRYNHINTNNDILQQYL